MNKTPKIILILPLLGVLALAGCGESFTVAEGGIGGTGISTGTVTGIGSITVNGVKFNTDNAAIYVEGVRVDDQCPPAATAEDCLRNYLGFNEGQVVRVVGTFSADGRTGTATAVYYNDSIEGPVTSVTQIDATTLQLVVMGQNIIVTSQTYLFDTTPAPITLNDINVGELIEVSGLLDDQNRIYAGYLLSKGLYDPSDQVEIKGIIESLSPGLNNFRINGLLVDYSTVSLVPSLQVGMQVEVKGTYNGTKIDASRIEQEDDIGGSDDDKVEYEGIVMSAPAPSLDGITFMLGTKNVQTNLTTVYKNGLAADIITGVHLEIEGYQEGGILIADEVRFRDSIELDAQVENYAATAANDNVTITMTGLTGVNILVNELSKIEVNNLSGASNDLASLIDALASGDTDYVKVRGRCLNCNDLGALERDVFAEEIKIENDSGEQDVKLQGPVISIDEPSDTVTVLGVSIDTTTVSDLDSPEKLAAFFASLQPGYIVSVEGVLSGPTINWDSIELEDDE
ncbi:MAG: DUF5666 domain-containing protein [Thiohalomonadales bacterium]|nr:DUF5666 domain-containing protein [Thiohalomonadales bacterium]